ncbi:hypothetical protein MTR67_030834 [Solanum verrucosum]|uniref:Tf2-1-like SH3-like domain-containing protein n=1 Tax=Solanum verrucosum TaxID=315347 RepID=A0AAF0U1D7_SOLVR|nr:hypothetical protein MTR67_030834 [Solanum verrucosum]
MVCLFLSFQTGVHSLLPSFGGSFRGSWAPVSNLAQHFIRRLMASQSALFRCLRICCGLVSWTLEVSRTSFCPWQSLRTTTATTLVFRLPRSRPYMTDGLSKRTIQVLEDTLRACVMDFGGQTARSRHQSYADRRRRSLRFVVGNRVFLRLLPMKGMMRLGRQVKLSHRYIGPSEILRTVGEIANELTLTLAFSTIHPVFHVLMLRRYVPDDPHVLQYDAVKLDDRLIYIEEPVAILDRAVRQLQYRATHVVELCWRHHLVKEATWEAEQKSAYDAYWVPIVLGTHTTLDICFRDADLSTSYQR